MFIKVVNNLGKGWVITEEDDDGFSAVGNDFLQYFAGVLHNEPWEAEAEDTGIVLYLALKLMN